MTRDSCEGSHTHHLVLRVRFQSEDPVVELAVQRDALPDLVVSGTLPVQEVVSDGVVGGEGGWAPGGLAMLG